MSLAVLGVSHRTAPVEVRERVAFGPAEAARALLWLRDEGGVEEAILLSTCNRTEVYLFPAPSETEFGAVEALLARRAGPLVSPLSEYLFRRQGHGAVRHLFEVTSGLDSMVTGEAEIQGQVRDAYELAAALPLDPPVAGPVMNRLFQMALSVGGRVRAETSIAEGAASVASVAVDLARKIFGSLRGRRVLIMGAGVTAELMVDALARDGVEGILVANRTYDRAMQLAERLHGRAVQFDRMVEALPSADIILSSTAAPHPVLTREAFRKAFPEGRRRPLLAIDVAVPRDIDPAVGDERDVFLYNVDDLRRIVDEHVRIRSDAVPEADRLITAQAEAFRSWYASREVVPVIREMRGRAEEHRAHELDRLFGKLDHLNEEDRSRVEEFSRRLLRKILHQPSTRLRRSMVAGRGEELVDAIRFLYGLDGPDSGREGSRKERAPDAAPDEPAGSHDGDPAKDHMPSEDERG